MSKFKDEKIKDKIEFLKKREAEDLTQILSQKYKFPYIDLAKTSIDLDALKIVSEEDSQAGQLVVFQKTGKKIQIGLRNPELLKTKKILEYLKEHFYNISVFLISEASLNKALSKYAEIQKFEAASVGLISISSENLEQYIRETRNINDLKEILTPLINIREIAKVSKIVEVILAGAYSLEASDIHIEPQNDRTRLRFRLDGVLYDVLDFPLKVYTLLLSRLKLIGALKLNLTNNPQDGRFTIKIKELEVEVRLSTLPGSYGEFIVLRVLHPKTIGISFENLGMQPDVLKMVEHEIKKPNGMILTTGPTGSGKTTTLYAFLKKVANPGVKIITIENPIEYHIKGITQSQIDPSRDYGFANALRSVLRQDPDIVLVGEIRDLETTKTALNAALTGHLVFATLHTNNAFGTVPRLLDLGAKPNVIAPAINVAIAQRLLRVLCATCKKKVKANQETIEYLKRIASGLPKKIKKPELKKLEIWEPTGCDECNNTGYKGRIGIYEAFRIDEKAEQLILNNPLESEFKKIAINQEMMTMEQDGLLKILSGITNPAELKRVVGE